jgi:[acyl-carrier-protein] S-malonyltransferase
MGLALAQASPAARAIFAEADRILDFPLSDLCFHGPQATLDDTLNTQPALLTTSVAALRAWEEAAQQRGQPLAQPLCCAGHSLGEYSALVAAEALAFPDALRLVRERGRLMKQAGEAQPGAMAALIGADDATAEAVATAAGVQVANFNSPGQVIVSGSHAGIARLAEVAKARGVRRVIPLAVSIAAHSELMRPIVAEFRQAVEATPMQPPRLPVVSNATARPFTDVEDIRATLVNQLIAPVRWVASIEYMAAEGARAFVEIGSGNVLTGFVKRILKDADARTLGTPDDIDALLSAYL